VLKDYRVAIAAIIAICIMECVALLQGVNGLLMSATVGAVAGIGGLSIDLKKLLRR